ncbi:tetratricopeptide repeat protein [Candidatus Sumerlaeota bacterium]|nr:tetratricopeptide repeat protein [Candidatus Sumerlaeota bacterium]
MTPVKENQLEKDGIPAAIRMGGGFFLVLVFLWGGNLSVRVFLSEVHFYRAYRLLNTDAFLQAEIPTKRAVELNPSNGYTYYYYGTFLRKINKNDEALDMFLKSLNTIAHPASVLKQLAPFELEEKRYQNAIEHYRLALLYNPVPAQSPATFWFDYGKSADKAGFRGEALYAFRKAQTFDDPPVALYSSIGFVLASLGMQNSAVEEFLSALGTHPELMDELSTLALALTKTGLFDLGNEIFSRLYAMGKLDAKGLCLFASFPMHEKDYEDSLRILEWARNVEPNEPNIFLLMGEIYYRKGEKESMKRAYQRYLELYPDAPQKAELQKRIQE